MSVVKLLSRIVAPDIEEVKDKSLHDHTYGITSDPLTRFAVVLSALIHDVDHTGVSNAQLVKEKRLVATYNKNKGVAGQNSVDLAWDLLMEPQYESLRRQIYAIEAKFKRFRQLVVNSIMATDILDKDLQKLRRAEGTKVRGQKQYNWYHRKITYGGSKYKYQRRAKGWKKPGRKIANTGGGNNDNGCIENCITPDGVIVTDDLGDLAIGNDGMPTVGRTAT